MRGLRQTFSVRFLGSRKTERTARINVLGLLVPTQRSFTSTPCELVSLPWLAGRLPDASVTPHQAWMTKARSRRGAGRGPQKEEDGKVSINNFGTIV
jgi:hypothetical protein